MSKLILIFAIIGFSFTDDVDQCYTKFEEFLQNRCKDIKTDAADKCTYFSSIQRCTKPTACLGGTTTTCSNIIPINYKTEKCKMSGSTCQETDKLCEDYEKTWGDNCLTLKFDATKGDRCDFSYFNKCTHHFNDCTKASKEQCTNNIPSDFTKKCVLKNNACTAEPRLCSDTYYKIDETNCNSLTASDNKKKCFYLNKACTEYYETCENYVGTNKTECENIKPLNSAGNGFDISKNCTFDSTSKKCETKSIMCTDYLVQPEDNKTCYELTASDTTKYHCIYDFEKKICREEYKTCEDYNNLLTVKNKETCENISLKDVTKKCVFEEDVCKTETKECSDYKSYEPVENCINIMPTDVDPAPSKVCRYNGSACIEDYKTCGDYKGTDKKICESINDGEHKCILEKDTTCTNKPFYCSEAKNIIECMLMGAVAENSRKQCFYYSDQCIEMYKSCEDYNGYYKQECETIVALDGYNCVFQSPNCVKFPKICSEALSEGECGIITTVSKGLSDPDKMICEYDSSSGKCFENYKYCNDYKGSDADVCALIKPYKSDGSGIDPNYKCVYNNGCERKLLACSEATNKGLCESISGVLEGISKKYCLYKDGVCSEQYQKCIDYSKNVQKDACQAILPQNYITHHCEFQAVGNVNSCVEKENTCESFKVDDYEYECKILNPLCSYSNGVCSTATKACSDIVFLTQYSGDRKTFCNSIKVENENKICSVSADGTKCEETDKPSEKEETPASGSSGTGSQNNQNSESQGDSSDSSNLLKLKGIKLILILLYILF